MASLRPLALLLAGALLATGCEDDSVTLPGEGAARAIIEVTVDPNPVPGSQNPLTGAVSVGYNVTITEVNGLGGELLFVSSQIYDPETGLQVALNYFDGADLVVFVGSKRVEALDKLVVPQTSSYILPDFRKPAQLAVNVQMKDDRGNLLNQSVLVKIE
jgi:hypothetical protein